MEEALKMRNLLEEFNEDHGVRPPTILGFREHIFTGRLCHLLIDKLSHLTAFLMCFISPLQCFFFGLVYVKSGDKFRHHWSKSVSKAIKV